MSQPNKPFAWLDSVEAQMRAELFGAVRADAVADIVFDIAGAPEMRAQAPSVHWLRMFVTRLEQELGAVVAQRRGFQMALQNQSLLVERLSSLDAVAYDYEGRRELDAETLKTWLAERRRFASALRESLTYVEMAGGADNSGEEYPLQCQSCGGTGANRHYHDCRLVAFERRVSEILAQPKAGA